MQAVILAAGKGSRLQSVSDCKPLTPLLGTPLLERNLRLAHQAGATEIVVVTGYQHERIETWLRAFMRRTGWSIRIAHNTRWHDTENGYSLLQAADHINRPFLLMMSDHVYSPELLAKLAMQTPGDGAVLAVDRRLERPDIDPGDVTRVKSEDGGCIVDIGKGIAVFNGLDTGAFLCSPAILNDLRTVAEEGKTQLSQLMLALAAQKRFRSSDIADAYWADIDTAADLDRARRALLRQAAGKPADGPVSRYLNRPVSRRLTERLVGTAITPNQISWAVLGITLCAAALLSQQAWPLMALGALLAQFASILDGCDGEIARLRLQGSVYGGWLDAQLDRYGDAALISALIWNVMSAQGAPAGFWVGMFALIGSFMVSYSAHKSDHLLKERIRVGRDVRILIIAVGAILGQPLAVLWVLAIGMNLTVAIRLWSMRNAMR